MNLIHWLFNFRVLYKHMLKEESIYLNVGLTEGEEELHIKRFYTDENGPPVLMAHGSVENGKIFYSDSGKGLAPYLSKKGFDVFVIDFRGRGLSKPSITKGTRHGLSEIIQVDVLAFVNKVKELKGNVPQHWIAHSFGGLFLLGFLARNKQAVKVASMIFVGTRRQITVVSLKKIWTVDFMWRIMGRLLVKWKGYLPAKDYNAGLDNETIKSFIESNRWLKEERWQDYNDKFDYGLALRSIKLPDSLFLTATNDAVLCHPKDMRLFMKEVGAENHEMKVIGKQTGYKHDYGHNTILTHKDAPEDVYPILEDFIRKGM